MLRIKEIRKKVLTYISILGISIIAFFAYYQLQNKNESSPIWNQISKDQNYPEMDYSKSIKGI